MDIKFCDVKKNYNKYKDEINDRINNIMINGQYIEGPDVNMFENNFAKYIGVKHCIGVGNGTDALIIAIKALNLPEGSEIIIPGNTYIATALAVVNNNMKLVLADIDENMMICNLENHITSKTKALIVVHMYGIPQNMDMICSFCKKYNLYLIEDCAQAHGAMMNNMKVGSFGDISCFSFYPTKNLGACGDAGCIVTNNDKINNYIRKYKNFGSIVKNNHEIIGINSRLDTIQAAILDVKLKYLDNDNQLRKQNASYYYDLLKDNKKIVLIKNDGVHHLFIIRTEYRKELILHLKYNNIETAIHYPKAICDMDIFSTNYTMNCHDLSNEILSLPMYPELTYDEIKYICDKINSFSIDRMISIRSENKIGTLHYMNINNFPVKRFFYIDNINNVDMPIERGNHAIINFNEMIIIISGCILLKLRNKYNDTIYKKILYKNDTFIIYQNNWINYTILEPGTILLVFCDKKFEDSIIESDESKFFL